MKERGATGEYWAGSKLVPKALLSPYAAMMAATTRITPASPNQVRRLTSPAQQRPIATITNTIMMMSAKTTEAAAAVARATATNSSNTPWGVRKIVKKHLTESHSKRKTQERNKLVQIVNIALLGWTMLSIVLDYELLALVLADGVRVVSSRCTQT